MVELPDNAKQIKNVFLYRTGNYIVTFWRAFATVGTAVVNGDCQHPTATIIVEMLPAQRCA